MNEQITIREFLKNFRNGRYDANDVDIQIKAGWHDWWCSDEKLRNKTVRMAGRLGSIIKTNRFDIDKAFVIFKNNEPINGRRYDSFSICDIQNGNVLYCIVPMNGHEGQTQGCSEVWGDENKFNGPLVTGTWDDVKAFFSDTKNS